MQQETGPYLDQRAGNTPLVLFRRASEKDLRSGVPEPALLVPNLMLNDNSMTSFLACVPDRLIFGSLFQLGLKFQPDDNNNTTTSPSETNSLRSL